MNQGMRRLLAGMLCAWLAGCNATAIEPESLDSITARLDQAGGKDVSIDDVPQALDAWLATHPDSSDAWIQYARYYLKSGFRRGRTFEPGALDRAWNALDRAEKLAPRDPDVDILRGHVLDLMNRTQEAEAVLARAAQRGGDTNPWLRLNRASLHLRQGRWAEAMQDCDIVAARKDLNSGQRLAADECRIEAYEWKGEPDTVERIYRDAMAYAGDSAWHHGNFARFLLCSRDNAKEAVVEARRAREIMDYGIARLTEGAALARDWAKEVDAGKGAAAEATFKAAGDTTRNPIAAYVHMCGTGGYAPFLVRTAFEAGRLHPRSAKQAIAAAADAAEAGDEDTAHWAYRIHVRSEGRDADGIQYLRSEPDDRNPGNLSLSMSRQVQSDWRLEFTSRPEQVLLGKDIVVIGTPRRVRIDDLVDGKPTGKFQDRTQIEVTSSSAIVWDAPPPRRISIEEIRASMEALKREEGAPQASPSAKGREE